MNLASGTFAAPRTGTYFFSFSGVANFPNPTSGNLDVSLILNGNHIGRAQCNYHSDLQEWETMTLQSTLHLQAGDKISLQIVSLRNSQLRDSSLHYTHFTGFLLSEDVALSL